MSLPTVGGSKNTWGSLLLSFLRASHNEDGTIKEDVIADIQSGMASQAELDALAAIVALVGEPDLSGVDAAIALKADQSALDDALTEIEDKVGSAAFSAALASIATKAEAEDVESLDTRMTAAEIDISDRITQAAADTLYPDKNTTEAAIASHTTALAPGNDGDLKATVGGVVSNIKPGRIDARVRGLSTASSDNTTLLGTLATEAASTGAEMWVPEGVYRTGELVLASNLTIRGTGTLKHKTTSPSDRLMRVPSGATENILIEGITLDGNGAKGLLDAAYWPGGATNITIRGVTFQNTHADYEKDHGITANGIDGLVIEGCTFDCEAPIRIFNAHGLKIRNNLFKRAGTRNAIDLQNYDAFVSRGLEISGNTFRECYRMAIELVRQHGTAGWDAPLLAHNDIEIADTHDSEAFGISINWSPRARFLGNTVAYRGSGTYPIYAYEVVNSPGTKVIDGNVAINCLWVVSVNKSSNCTVDDNTIYHCNNGIILENDSPNSTNSTVTRNLIEDCEDVGILDGYHASSLSGGNVIADNVIIRNTAWADDATTTFHGIESRQQDIPSQYIRNRIEQGQAVPTSGFAFYGIVALGSLGLHEDSRFSDNLFLDRKTGGGMMYPLVAMSGGAQLADATTTGNVLTLATGVKSDANTWPL